MNGYAETVALIDLDTGEVVRRLALPEEQRPFVGGCGYSYKLLFSLFKPGMDPLSPEVPMAISVGPLVGTLVPGTGKFHATVKFPNPASPSLDRYFIGSASSGSRRFALMLKNAGLDGVILLGRASRPSYLLVDDDLITLCPADNLWGKSDTYRTIDFLQQVYPGAGAVAIGSAGENLVRFALAITDKTSTLGRNGLGAVLGSKNLKAIVVRGSKGVDVAHKEWFLRAVHRVRGEIAKWAHLKEHHTLGIHAHWEAYRQTMHPGLWPRQRWDRFYGKRVAQEAIADNLACTGCMLACRSSFPLYSGPHAGERTYTGTFLHLANLGQAFNLTNWREVAVLLDLCNRAGMSVVELRGIMRYLEALKDDEPEVGELRLEDGLPGAERLLQKVVARQGIGEVIAEGWFAMAQHFGLDVREYISLAKGGACSYDPRATGLDAARFTMAVNPRGGMHAQAHSATSTLGQPPEVIIRELENAGATPQEIERVFEGGRLDIARLSKHIQDQGMALDSLGVCVVYAIHGLLHLGNLTELYVACTGLEASPRELKEAGERAFNLLKLLNVREGFSRQDDRFPEIWFREKRTPDGTEVLQDYYRTQRIGPLEAEKLLDHYYDERGWDRFTGTLTPDTLSQLSLDGLVLEQHKKL